MKLRELLILSEAFSKSLIGAGIHSEYGKTKIDGTIKEWPTYFDCSNDEGDFNRDFTSLEGCPEKINGYFSCMSNKITSLEHGPSDVSGYYNCAENELTSLEYSPTIIPDSFYCSHNKLTSLENGPSEVHDDYWAEFNKLASLKDIQKHIKRIDGVFRVDHNPITSHILGVLLIENCTRIRLDNKEVESIVNQYLPNREGRKGLLKCKGELVDAGFDAFAQL